MSGKELHSLEEHTDVVNCCAFNYDNTKVLTVSHDGTVKVCTCILNIQTQNVQIFNMDFIGSMSRTVKFSILESQVDRLGLGQDNSVGAKFRV